ncbi:MAG: hypothetical protein FD123_1630 [Bacteroidetes bacterium]|nr:MAG: hypothetical protein FD123_1630 [Bacteroidota bacterium]
MPDEKIVFEEKQFLGLNRHSIMRRLILAVFCFIAYYWSENPKPVDTALFKIGEYPGDTHYGQLFFLMGIVILLFSALLLFVLHMRTLVVSGVILIDGLWSARRVRIEIGSIVSARKARLKPSFFNRPVYNLHTKGRIRFYTYGNEVIELTMNDGIIYRIGTQKADLLLGLIQDFNRQ